MFIYLWVVFVFLRDRANRQFVFRLLLYERRRGRPKVKNNKHLEHERFFRPAILSHTLILSSCVCVFDFWLDWTKQNKKLLEKYEEKNADKKANRIRRF